MPIHATVTTFDELCAEFVTILVDKFHLSTTQVTTLTTALGKRPGLVKPKIKHSFIQKQILVAKSNRII